MMNPEVKAKWLEALRSGEYKQARHTLRSCNGGFCCLGVLSDVYRKEVGGSWEWAYDDDTAYSIVNKNQDDYATVELPNCIKHWAEVDACNPQVHLKNLNDDNPGFISLAELNDEGKTFNEIADLIEKQL